jgi:hypothetical protein
MLEEKESLLDQVTGHCTVCCAILLVGSSAILGVLKGKGSLLDQVTGHCVQCAILPGMIQRHLRVLE